MIVQIHHNVDVALKNYLRALGFEPLTFQLATSCHNFRGFHFSNQ